MLVVNVPNASTNSTTSPTFPAGKLTVIAPPVVFIKYPSPATAVKVDVLTDDCQSVPPPTKVAPDAIFTVSPEAPNVIVVPL